MESPSPDDKVFAEFEGRLVAMTRDETCRAIQLVEVCLTYFVLLGFLFFLNSQKKNLLI
jgi:hypothetical protein